MRPSFVRYMALGVLAAGLAAIVWTAVRGDDSDDFVASPVTTAPAGAAPDGAAGPSVTAGAGSDEAPAGADAATTATTAPTVSGDSGEDTADDPASATATTAATAAPDTTSSTEPIEVLGTADTLTNLDGWLNTDATSLEEIRAANKLTVVQFWTFGCRNCKNTLEALSQLYTDFRGQGMEIVGVHSPEFSYEADVDNIIEASADLGVIWPIALDTDKRNFHRWQPGNIGYWPRVYVIDGDNQIRFDRTGDGRATYAQLYETVERLLAEA
jgi:thiol-disulfide isomerase/thioredoxin